MASQERSGTRSLQRKKCVTKTYLLPLRQRIRRRPRTDAPGALRHPIIDLARKIRIRELQLDIRAVSIRRVERRHIHRIRELREERIQRVLVVRRLHEVRVVADEVAGRVVEGEVSVAKGAGRPGLGRVLGVGRHGLHDGA